MMTNMMARAAALILLCCAGARAAGEPRVRLDARLETLGVVQLLAEVPAPKGFQALDAEYARRARKTFARFKDHRAVRLTAGLPVAFDYLARTDFLVRRGPLPEIGPRLFIPEFMNQQAGGRARLEEWVSALADFAREAGVEAFVKANEAALDPGLSAFREDVARRRYMAKMESLAGVEFEGEYEVIPSVFHLPGAQVNAVVRLEEGGYYIVSVVGAELRPEGRLDYRTEDFVATAGHEIAHGLLDVASELSREHIGRSGAEYAKLSWDCYGDWMQCVKETVVRAHMLRLVASELGEDAVRRELNHDDGRERWPYLEPMAEKFKIYEKDRKRWPDLYAYYPRLLEVFPEDADRGAKGRLVSSGPGPEWISDETRPFASKGQRAFALRALGRLLAGSPRDADYLRRRAALHLTASDFAEAEKDAQAAMSSDPSDLGALFARALSRRGQGRGTEAAADMAAVVRACVGARADRSPVACGAAIRGSTGGMGATGFGGDPGPDPNVGPGVVTRFDQEPEPGAPAAPGEEDFDFVVDSRLELLSEVLASTPSPSRPATVILDAALRRGVNPVVPLQILFAFGDAPDLAPRLGAPMGQSGAFGGTKEVAGFVEALRTQARETGFSARWAASARSREQLLGRARGEARRTLSPAAVSAWLATPFPAKVRFILSDTLPSAYAANLAFQEGGRRVEARTRSVMGQRDMKVYFSLDDFGGSPAHELTHTITDPLVLSREMETARSAALMVPQCTDNWSGCVLEHIVLGVTLRALRAEQGEPAYRRVLDHYAQRGFPYLSVMCDRLADYENPAARAAGFGAFVPRALGVFDDELKKRGGR
jgi:tetratricopeptide (TPR) repeat protein